MGCARSRRSGRRIPGARYVELDGIDSLPFVGDSDAIIDEIENFLTGRHSSREVTRALLTLMFTDIVASTARASELGDRRWRDLLAQHDEALRREISFFGGREVKTLGDGFLAVFDGPPSRALRCARAVTGVARELGVEIRVGLHTGECELIDDDVGGIAVHVASRVSALAGPARGARLGDRGRHRRGRPVYVQRARLARTQGRPGRWALFALDT